MHNGPSGSEEKPGSGDGGEGNRVKIRTIQAVVRGHLYDADSGEVVRPAPPGQASFTVADVLTDEEVAALANWPVKPATECPPTDALTYKTTVSVDSDGPDLRYGVDYELGDPYTPRVEMFAGGFMFVDDDLFTPEPYLVDGQEPASLARQEMLERLTRLGDLDPGGDPRWSIAATEGEIVLPVADGREG